MFFTGEYIHADFQNLFHPQPGTETIIYY